MSFDSITGRYILIFAAVYAAVKFYPKIKTFISLWQMRFKVDEFALVDEGQPVPLARPVATVLDLCAVELQQLGFEAGFSFDCIGDPRTRRCCLIAPWIAYWLLVS